MCQQIFRILRCGVFFQIAGRGEDHPVRINQRTGYQAGVTHHAGADSQINPFIHQVNKPVLQMHFHFHIRVFFTEFRDAVAENQLSGDSGY